MEAATTAAPPKTDANGSGDPDDIGSAELIVATGGQLDFGIGGKKPTSATLRLTGGKIDVEGSFQKGQRVAVRVEAVVNELGFKDEEDAKTGQVVGCERRHKARITGVSLIED